MHNYTASCIKTGFDKIFGENNYVVIPIGRSLSSIGKSLEAKIEQNNVVNVPLSCGSRFLSWFQNKESYKNILDNIKNDNGLNNFVKYLEMNNIAKKDIESSNKHYVLIDYCASGMSLKGAEQLFKSDLVWGNKNKNIHAVDIINYMKNFDETSLKKYKEELFPNDRSITSALEYNLIDSRYKSYSTITKSRNLEETINASKEKFETDKTPRETKLVWFQLMDDIITRKENLKPLIKPKTEKGLIPSEQNIELWHNSATQYEDDFVKDTYNCIVGGSNNKENIVNKKIQYYKLRSNIQKILDEINL